jgi:hypothetical protein
MQRIVNQPELERMCEMLRPLTLFVLACAAVASAQTAKKTAQQPNPTTQTFIDLENKWNDALVKADPVALAVILADGYVSTDEQGHQRTNHPCDQVRRRYQTLKMPGITRPVRRCRSRDRHQYGTDVGRSTAPARISWTDTFIRGTARGVLLRPMHPQCGKQNIAAVVQF